MGASLYIQRSNGTYADSPTATRELAIEMFDSIPWREEFAHFDSLPPGERSEIAPEFGLVDDSGRILRIFPFSPEHTAFIYSHAILETRSGAQEASFLTDVFPPARAHELIELYFAGEHGVFLKLVDEFPHSKLGNSAEQKATMDAAAMIPEPVDE